MMMNAHVGIDQSRNYKDMLLQEKLSTNRAVSKPLLLMTESVQKHRAQHRASYDEKTNPYLIMSQNRHRSVKRSIVIDFPL
jgi:uncharacterized membrane protein